MRKLDDSIWEANLKWISLMVKLSQKLEQKQKLSPQQVLQASLLQLNLPLLEQRILHELEINPALELNELPIEGEIEENPEEKSEEEKENYKNSQGGYYEKRIDTDNPKIYDEFFEGMLFINEKMNVIPT